jgi:hypothetical protein
MLTPTRANQGEDMNLINTSDLSTPAKLNVGALAAFAALILIQIAGGVDYPTIPPGAVISAIVIAVVVIGARSKWATALGAAWPLVLSIGMVLADETADRLSTPDDVFVFLTALAQATVIAIALVSGIAATARAFQKSS